MAEVVIKIPQSTYNFIIGEANHNPMGLDYFERRVAEGTLLPKGHGRLIDADKVRADMWVLDDSDVKMAQNIINDATTIIEADKGGD